MPETFEERGLKVFAPATEDPSKEAEVFFNKKMLINRDISKVVLEVFREKIDTEEFRAVDAMSASGIRGFRYADHVDRLILNDANPHAVEGIEKGLEANDIEAEVTNKDANVLLSEWRNAMHFIDVDPFGPFTPFLDSTARAANYQSFVGLTATDNAAPAGSYPTVCRRRYGSNSFRSSFKHETGLRIYVKEVFENFARYDKCFDPKVCFHHRHYSRVMGRVTESKKRTNRALDNIGYLSYCPQCLWRDFKRTDSCDNCGSGTKIAGPLWTGKFVDTRFTGRMLEKMPEEWEDAYEMVETLDAEAEILTPFYDLHAVASSMKEELPKRDDVIAELRSRGYPVARTHMTPTGIKTDAPIGDIKDVMRLL